MIEAKLFVPGQPIEIFADRVERALLRPLVDGLVGLVLADLRQALVL
jgi:hypothetical protein